MKTQVVILSFILFSCTNDSESPSMDTRTQETTYEEKKQSLEEIEKANPERFIKVSGTYRQNLIDQWVLEGTIRNTAKTARYKDVVIKVYYYSKTDTELGTEDKVFYEFFEPGSTREFKIKLDGVGGTERVDFQFSSAIAVD